MIPGKKNRRCKTLRYPQGALFLMPDIIQRGLTLPSVTVSPLRFGAKQAVMTVVIRVFVVSYIVKGSDFLVRIPDRKTNRLLIGR